MHRDTPVVNYKSDRKTREFFKSQIGPEFHFTYHVNQYRLAHDGLTYGDLINEWIAARDRRNTPNYQPKIADHGEYNQFVRDYFADAANRGKTMRDAAGDLAKPPSGSGIMDSRGVEILQRCNSIACGFSPAEGPGYRIVWVPYV